MTGIPGLGGHNPHLQRALLDLVDKAEAEEAELPVPAQRGAAGGSARPAGTSSASAPSTEPAASGVAEQAVILELSDEVVDLLATWAPSRGDRAPGRADAVPGRSEAAPAHPPRREIGPRPAAPQARGDAAPMRSSTAPPPRPGAAPQVRSVPLDQLIAVLKRSGTDFKQAAKILANIELDQPLPGKAVLKALWEEPTTAPTQAAPSAHETKPVAAPQAPAHRTAAQHVQRPAPERPAPRTTIVETVPLDHLVRSRGWHGAHPERPEPPEAHDVPTLRSVVVDQPVNQVYVAGLTTAEYQRLLILLGDEVPEWFADVRHSRGLRGLMERGLPARLNTTRFAGMRVGAWGLAAAGVAIAWYAGIRTGSWW